MTDAIMPDPPRRLTVEVEVTHRVQVNLTPEGAAGVERYVGLEPGNEWHFTPHATHEQVIFGIIQTSLYTGHEDLSYCDGWADMPVGAITVLTVDITEYP